MFCSNCGKQISDSAKFCKYCGCTANGEQQNETLKGVENGSRQLNTVFNRDVLSNYLYNIRTLEFYKNKLVNQKYNMEYQISGLGIRKVGDGGASLLEFEDIGPALGCSAVGLAAGLIFGWIKNTWVGDFFEIEGFLGGLSVLVIVASILIAIGSVIYFIVGNVQRENEYKENLANDNKRVSSELIEKDRLNDQLELLIKEIDKTDSLLTDAYSLNIVPSKFRNIYASYFLYDFISTSTASLNEALLHCDLDTIQQQLENVIQQQSEIIMELARANALNERFVSQNDQILSHAIQTENNTALAAQYAKVSAMNTSITACIQMSEYLRP